MEIRDDLRTEIGKGLQWLRKSLALTQYQLAALAHLDYRHYQNIETGRVEVKVETLKRICEAFGFGLSAFFSLVDRKPWLHEKSGKLRGNGDVYVFRIEHEHAHFRMHDEVKEVLLGWGRDLAEGNRDSLQASPFPCLEVDRQGRCIWKNHSSHELPQITTNSLLVQNFAVPSDAGPFAEAVESFFEKKLKSLYLEVVFNVDASSKPMSYFALLGLDSQSQQVSQSLFLACINISRHFVVADAEQLNPDLNQLLLYCYSSNLRFSRGSSGKS